MDTIRRIFGRSQAGLYLLSNAVIVALVVGVVLTKLVKFDIMREYDRAFCAPNGSL